VTRDRVGRELVTPEGDLITEELDSGDADAQAAKTAPP
jgi:hypothetical protein